MKTYLTTAVLFTCLISGCVSHTTIKDEPRQKVRFSSPEAAQVFYDAYLSADSPKGRGSMSVFVALPYKHQTTSTDNVRFNSAVQTADRDRNGVISKTEADAFAVQQRPR